MISFSLLDQPWIPCAALDGQRQEIGLREALAHAHKLRGVECANPLETAAILRLMLAVLHRVFTNRGRADWAKHWQAGGWECTQLDEYWGRWGERFDLFHPRHPFYQQKIVDLEPRTIARILPGVDAAAWFNHEMQGQPFEMTPAEAARSLIAVQAFGLPGIRHPQKKLFFSGGPWLAGLVFFVEGNSLFETLALNFLPYDTGKPRPNLGKTETDLPAWEMDDPFSDGRTVPRGYLDYLTFPNRRIFLLPVETPQGVRVREMIDGPGLKLQVELYDPFKHYFLSRDKKENTDKWVMLFLHSDKALWRNSHSLLGVQATDGRPVEALNWLAGLAEDGEVEETARYRLMAVGMVSDQAKADLVRMERISLSIALLRDPSRVSVLADMIDKADEVSKALSTSLFRLAKHLIAIEADQKDGREPDSKDCKALMTHWSVGPLYWQALEQPFLMLMDDLAAGKAAEEIKEQWRQALSAAAWGALEAAIRLAGDTPQGLKAAVLARGSLAFHWKKVYPDSSPQKGG